jgi:integrase
MSRTDYGAGSVYQRKDGRWCAAITDPQTGKRKVRYAKTEREASRALRDMQARAHDGTPVIDARTPFKSYAEWWLENRAGRNRRPSTIAVYASRLNTHVTPVLGGLKLGEVTLVHIESLLDSMHRAGASAYVIRDTRVTLSALLSDAVKSRLLRANPAQLAQLPEDMPATATRTTPSTDEVRALIECTKDTELGNLVVLLAYSGARVGEALAAQWTDLDLDTGEWRIWQTVTRTRTGGHYLGGKTKTGRSRVVMLPPAALDALRDQRTKVAAHRLAAYQWDSTHDLVFPTTTGTVRDAKPLRQELHKVAPEWPGTFHDLRHWFASVSITDTAMTSAAVSKVLGHASTRTTMDTYGHLLPESATAVSGSITRALN